MPFCKLQACCHVPFSQKWLQSGHSPINPRCMKCCKAVVLLAGSSILAKELCSSVRVAFGFLVIFLTKVFLALLLSLVRWPARGRVWVVPYSFHFLIIELTVLLGTFNILEIVLCPSPDLGLLTILSRSSTDSSLDFMVEFLPCFTLLTVGPHIERCGSF